MLWRDKYGSIIKEEAHRPLWQERRGREVKIHQCFSSSLDVAFCFFSPIFLPPFSPILGKAKLFIGLISTLLFLREKGGLKRGRKMGEWPVFGAVRTNSYMDMGCGALDNYNSDIRDHQPEITIIHRIIMKMPEVLQELSKCDRNEWKNAIEKMAPKDLLDRVAMNIHFIKKCHICKAL